MTLETSGAAQSANNGPHLAAAEHEKESALASRHMNGLYNEGHAESIPHTELKITLWDLVLAEWRTIGMVAAPFALAIATYMIPASRGELATVRTEAAANLDLAKAQTNGQLQAITAKVDALQTTIKDTNADLRETRADIKKVLERLPDPRQPYDLPQIVAASPAAPLENPSTPRRVKKKAVQPIAAKPSSGFRIW